MSYRPRLLLVVSLLILVSLALSTCSRERPVTTTGTPAAARGTVAASTPGAAGTQVALPTASGSENVQATPSAPSSQQVSPAAPAAGSTGQSSAYTVVAGDTLATIARALALRRKPLRN